jgi:hypothetical protein
LPPCLGPHGRRDQRKCPNLRRPTSLRQGLKDFWDNLDRQKSSKTSAEQFADLSRMALRGYEACTAGDERFTAKDFYEKLQSQANAKASDIFKDGAFGPGGSPNVKK